MTTQGWFTIDFLSGIPYDLLTVGVLSQVKGLKMLKGFRLDQTACDVGRELRIRAGAEAEGGDGDGDGDGASSCGLHSPVD